MYLNTISHYLPSKVIPNSYFLEKNGLSNEWIVKRTGILERRKASPNENTNTMAIEAVKKALPELHYPLSDVDLIVGATYSSLDNVATVSYITQKHFNISNAKVLTVAAACSSFINAVEIVQGYFSMNKAKKALVIASEHNTAFTDEYDEQSGHLFGDGAAALFISKEKISDTDFKIIDINTQGLGNVGQSTDAVYLKPSEGGIKMPNGRDVFIHANMYMISALKEIIKKNNLSLENINYVIPHQANIRIIEHIRKKLELEQEKVIVNIDKLGNTGCASTPIAFSQNKNKFQKGDLIAITVFGGGYSSGAMLLQN